MSPHVIAMFCQLIGVFDRIEHRPLTAEEANDLVKLLRHNWQVLLTINDMKLDQVYAIIGKEKAQTIDNFKIGLTAWAKAQAVGHDILLSELESAKIQHVLLKGAATSRLLYDLPWQRNGWDLDIGVAKGELDQAVQAAAKADFVPAQRTQDGIHYVTADANLRSIVEEDHYELGFFVRRQVVRDMKPRTIDAIRAEPFFRYFWFEEEMVGHFGCYAVADLHHALSLDIPLANLIGSRRRATNNKYSIYVPANEWLVLHLVFKLYWEGIADYSKGLYQFADLARLMICLSESDIAASIALFGQFELDAAAFYTLRRLPCFGVRTPQSVDKYLSESAVPKRGRRPDELNDRGDLWWKLFGFRGHEIH